MHVVKMFSITLAVSRLQCVISLYPVLFTEGVGQTQETASCPELSSSCGTNEQLNPLDGNSHFVTA